MKIQDILEAFDSSHSFTDIDRYPDEDGDVGSAFSSSFKASDGTEVIVYFEPETMTPGTWDIHFERQTKRGGYGENISDQGDAFKIYATVLKIIKKFIEKKHPKAIKFSARKVENNYGGGQSNTQSREKLYDRMIQKFSSQMGYKLKRKIENQGMSLYILERNRGS